MLPLEEPSMIWPADVGGMFEDLALEVEAMRPSGSEAYELSLPRDCSPEPILFLAYTPLCT